MPTYEYVCRTCGEPLEVVQAFSDDALTECPRCQGELRKVFGSVGIVFKGGGFYKTDSRTTKSATSGSSASANHGHDHSSHSTDQAATSSSEATSTPASENKVASPAQPAAAP